MKVKTLILWKHNFEVMPTTTTSEHDPEPVPTILNPDKL
jgi:hypothetical protein